MVTKLVLPLNIIKNQRTMINVTDLIKGETYTNPNTGTNFVFHKLYRTDENVFAQEVDGTIHVSQVFRNLKTKEL